MTAEIKIIPAQPGTELGGEVSFEGADYKVDRLFSNGNEVRGSEYKILMQSERGLFGLKEIV